MVLAWGTLGGLLVSTLLPTVSEPAPAWAPATLVTPIAEPSSLEPAPPPTLAPTSLPMPTSVAARAEEPAPPIDVTVAGLTDAWLVRVERGPSIGSGIVVGPNGLIVTSEEVVDEGYAPIRVWLPDGQTLFAEILFDDGDQGLALLAVPVATTGVAPLVAGMEMDEPVLVVGSGPAPGDPPIMTTATLLAGQEQPESTVLSYRADEQVQVTQPAGSPLLDQDGKVVGIATRTGQVGVVVPAERVLAFVKQGEATWRALSRGPVPASGSGLAGVAVPSLVGQSVEPPAAEPGASLTLVYDILNPSARTQPAVLGASVRRDNVQAWTDDPANDTPVVVQPGRSVYRREFRLPVEARSGWYEVAWSILSPDKSASYALKTVTRVVWVPPAEPGPAAADTAQVTRDAVSVVRPVVPLPTPTVRRAVVPPPRPTATPAARPRPTVKPAPTPTLIPRRAPSPTPVRRR